jgi:putative transposase
LFQNRFHSSPLGEEHYWTALRYVEVNPRRAGLVEKLEEWEFSSARAHLTGVEDPLISLAPQVGRRSFTVADWREFLERTDAEKDSELLAALPGSRPCGSLEWIRSLEEALKRRLAKSPRGRPRVAPESSATA